MVWIALCAVFVSLAYAPASPAPASPAPASPPAPAARARSVTGVVVDKRGNALKGAAVQLENPRTFAIISFITEANGRYSFHRLSTDIDYTLTAKYKRWFSKSKILSKFDSKAESQIDLEIPVE